MSMTVGESLSQFIQRLKISEPCFVKRETNYILSVKLTLDQTKKF